MKTLTASAVYTALTNLCPQDGVDFRSMASLEPLFQAIINRIAYLAGTGPDALAVYVSTSALEAALPPSATYRGKEAIVNATGAEQDQIYRCVMLPAGTYAWMQVF